MVDGLTISSQDLQVNTASLLVLGRSETEIHGFQVRRLAHLLHLQEDGIMQGTALKNHRLIQIRLKEEIGGRSSQETFDQHGRIQRSIHELAPQRMH